MLIMETAMVITIVLAAMMAIALARLTAMVITGGDGNSPGIMMMSMIMIAVITRVMASGGDASGDDDLMVMMMVIAITL